MRGIDQSIADETLLGQGLHSSGPALVQRLLRDPAVTTVQTDPAPDNARAIRCYERPGFAASRISSPDGPATYMLCGRQALAGSVNPAA